MSEDREETRILTEEIARRSPEGQPAYPRMGAGKITLFLATVVVLLLLVSATLAIFTQTSFAIAVGVGAILLFLLNPGLWATLFRARERKAILEDVSRIE